MDKILALSMKNNQAVEMIYLSDKGQITQRMIRVLEINEHRFVAYCYLRQRKRTFKLNNILSIDIIRKKRKGA
ncbi:hypothetical protein E2329_23000 [Salmonella enterica subsp. enterica]|jgi:predicted DNA-binding transcriptional regulator YafY|nr:hypothetical protein [Salmonella enterica subsp. enterica serovar Paratyphi A]